MVSKKELQNAISECLNEPFTCSKCQKLADFITVYEYLYGEPKDHGKTVTESIVEYNGETEFASAINGKNSVKVWSVMDELMEAVKVLQPRIYDSVLQKIKD